jgi:hypothetical protein
MKVLTTYTAKEIQSILKILDRIDKSSWKFYEKTKDLSHLETIKNVIKIRLRLAGIK